MYFPQTTDAVFVTNGKPEVSLPTDVYYANVHKENKFSMAMARNASFTYAQDEGYDWIITLDVDVVIAQMPFDLPASGFSSFRAFRLLANEFIGDRNTDLNAPHRWEASPWYFLHRRIFSSRKYCEDYIGYGNEERDYAEVVLKDVKDQPCGGRVFHRWHLDRGVCSEENNELYLERRNSND